jgi:transcriptional regulator with PAS, ATPase and Fis domain
MGFSGRQTLGHRNKLMANGSQGETNAGGDEAAGTAPWPESLMSSPDDGCVPASVLPLAWTRGAGSGGVCATLGPRMREIEEALEQVGLSDAPVLVQGETGVGKELLAKRIHACSRRAGRPLLKLNCAAFPPELVESELFGCARGAFTGAFEHRPGKFEMAHRGSVLLDEIGDMDIRLQAKLLQVLQDGEFLRLGSNETVKVDVRIIAATHCDLQQAMQHGRFRKDLYYRLNVINIEIPPLRERREEILWLAEYFLSKHGAGGLAPRRPSQALLRAMLDHDWPGNVRELENMMRRLLALGREDLLLKDLAPASPQLHPSAVAEPVAEPTRELPLLKKGDLAKSQVELQAILTALEATQWNRKQAATLLGADYKTLLYKMKKLGISRGRLSRIA